MIAAMAPHALRPASVAAAVASGGGTGSGLVPPAFLVRGSDAVARASTAAAAGALPRQQRHMHVVVGGGSGGSAAATRQARSFAGLAAASVTAAVTAATASSRRRRLPFRRCSVSAVTRLAVDAAAEAAIEASLSAALGKDWPSGDKVTLSRLCRGWSISQLAGGYRYCGDDVICAHLAHKFAPGAKRMLDLGSGVGTIGLIWLAQQPRPFSEGQCSMLEAQAVSAALCRETLKRNGLEEAVQLHHGDLRDPASLLALGGGFDVVTANPPYMSDRIGALPQHTQRRHCRHEIRGGISEFVGAAASFMAPHGRFCIIHAAPRETEVCEALAASNFRALRRVDVLFRGLKKSVAFVCDAPAGDPGTAPPGISRCDEQHVEVQTLEVQMPDGAWHPEYIAMCESLGL